MNRDVLKLCIVTVVVAGFIWLYISDGTVEPVRWSPDRCLEIDDVIRNPMSLHKKDVCVVGDLIPEDCTGRFEAGDCNTAAFETGTENGRVLVRAFERGQSVALEYPDYLEIVPTRADGKHMVQGFARFSSRDPSDPLDHWIVTLFV